MNKNEKTINSRLLMVYKKSIQRINKYVPVPEIRLQGKWLQKEGFDCGQKIKILHQKNRIVITNGERVVVVL